MKVWSKYLLIGFLFMQPLLAAWAQAPRVKAEVDSTVFMIGRQVKFSLKAEGRADRSVVWPLLGDTLTAGVEIVKELKSDTVFSEDKSKVAFTRNYLITAAA